MRLSRALWPCLLVLAPAAPLVPLSGCGSDVPPTGTSITPIDTKQAASQNKAMEDFLKGKKAVPRAKTKKRRPGSSALHFQSILPESPVSA